MFELKKLNVHKIVATEGEKNRLLDLGFELVETEVEETNDNKGKKEDEKTKKDKA